MTHGHKGLLPGVINWFTAVQDLKNGRHHEEARRKKLAQAKEERARATKKASPDNNEENSRAEGEL